MIRRRNFLAGLLFCIGSLTLLITIFPIIFSIVRFKLFSPPRLIDPTAVSAYPVPHIVNIFGIATADYTNPSVWFDGTTPASSSATSVTYFSLSIPNLNLSNISVEVNGSDLKKNAIHFPGTSLPGNYGNTVIFGHSALPVFYKPGSPLTVFNPLLKIKIGDEVIIVFDDITYRYRIRRTLEVTPDQISVLSQHFDRHELTLITCAPLGTYWHRFVAVADLVN